MTGPLVQAIGWALLHLLWQGALVAAILAATLALLRRQSANTRYLASCGALLLLIGLGVATAYRFYQPSVETSFSASSSFSAPATLAAPASTGSAPAEWNAIAFIGSHLPQIVAIWLVGVLILSARLIAGWISARRLAVRGTKAAGEQWERSLWTIASTLRLWRPIRLLESAAVEVPTVIGWLRPVVLLPAASLSGLSTQQIEMVLAHELAHIRRHDFIVNLMQSVVETLLFYHPAVWWISRQIRVEREHCCDDLAVAVFGDPLQYARALTRFEELRLSASQTVVAANGGSLIDRVRRLVVARAESANWTSRWAAGAALLTVVVAVFFAPALPVFADHDEPAKKATTSTTTKTKTKTSKKTTTAANCDTKTATRVDVEAAPVPDVDVDDPDVDVEVDVDPDQATPAPVPVVAPMAIAAPVISESVRESVRGAMAISRAAMAAAAPEAPMGGIEGGVFHGILGGVRTRHRHIGEGGKLTVDDLIELRTAGVTSKYIDEMKSAGIGDLSLDDIVDLRLVGVTPAYVKTLADAGYSKLTAKDIVRLKASGVDAEFIRDLAKYRSK